MTLGFDNVFDPRNTTRTTGDGTDGVTLPEPVHNNTSNSPLPKILQPISTPRPTSTAAPIPLPTSSFMPDPRNRGVKANQFDRKEYGSSTQRYSLDYSQLNITDNGDWVWSPGVGSQEGTSVPVVLFGDSNGQPIVMTNYDGKLAPQKLDDYGQSILNKYAGKEGGITSLKQMLIRANFITGKQAETMLSDGDAQNTWLRDSLKIALRQGTAENATIGKQGGTKFNSFDDWIKSAKANPIWGTYTNGGTPSRQVSISRQKFRPEEFDIAIDNLFQQTIGRGATGDEVKQFIGMLNSYQNVHPQKTVSVTHGNTTTTTTSGGVNDAVAGAKMRELAMQNPDAENYNKATKYLDYFKAAIAAPVQLG
jgi:hypothetical protein